MKVHSALGMLGVILFSASLSANEGVITDTKPTAELEIERPVYYPHYENGRIMIDQCEVIEQKEKCHPVNAPAEPLKTALENIVSTYTELLGDHVKLKGLIQKQADQGLKETLLTDPETNKQYVMVAIGSNFYFPLESSEAKKGDYDLLYSALQYELERFKVAHSGLAWLSGDDVNVTFSSGVSEKQYQELSALYYTIRYAKLLMSPIKGKLPG